MKSKKAFLFGLSIFAIYLITVLTYGLSLLAEYKSGPSRAEFRFTELVRDTNRNLREHKTRTDDFNSTFLKSLGDVSDLACVQLLENGQPILSYPASLSNFDGLRSALITTKSTVLKTKDGNDLTLTAAMYVLSPKSISGKGLVAFFVILATTVCCIVYLLMQSKVGKPSNPEPKIVDDSELENDSDDFFSDELFIEDSKKIEIDLDKENLPDEESNVDVKNETDFGDNGSDKEVSTEIVMEKTDGPDEGDLSGEPTSIFHEQDDDEMDMASLPLTSNITQEEYQALTKDLLDDNDFEEPQPVEIEKKELTPDQLVLKPLPALELKTEDKAPVPVRKGVPEGLFSPVTGFGWEEYLLPRLDSELMRCASSDQDLALISIDIKDIDWSSDAGVEIRKLVTDSFKFRDMIFEYKDSGCVGIILGLDSEGAVSKAESLHTDIISILAKRRDYHVVSIGIANRNLRLISGSRLAMESQQALVRAMEDKESPIVSFKANPEKYRNFIAEESAKQEMSRMALDD